MLGTPIIQRGLSYGRLPADHPWAAPVYYCVDQQLNFYFSSQIDSLHSQHILKNPSVAFAIFDSHAKEGTGNGVQGSATASVIESTAEIAYSLRYYSSSFVSCALSDFDGSKPYRLFKLTPSRIFVLDPTDPVDKRVEVFKKFS